MAYVADPRGGAIRNYVSVPRTSIEDPAQFDPQYASQNDLETNQYKAYTDTLLYGLLFFMAFKFINKLKNRSQ